MSMSLPSYEKREGRDGKKEKVSFSSLSPITSFPSQRTKKAGGWNRGGRKRGGSFTLKASKGVSHQEHFPSRPFSRPKNLKIPSVFFFLCRHRHLSKIAKRGFKVKSFCLPSPLRAPPFACEVALSGPRRMLKYMPLEMFGTYAYTLSTDE